MIGPVALERTRLWAYLSRNPQEILKKEIHEEIYFKAENDLDVQSNKVRSTVIRSLMEIPQRGPMQPTSKNIAEIMKHGGNFLNYTVLKEREEFLQSVYMHYVENGCQNFLFGENLVNEFLETDTNDVLVEELQFPYEMAYYKFQSTNFITPEGQKADGMFLGYEDEKILLQIMPAEIGKPWFEITERACAYCPLIVIDRSEANQWTIEAALERGYRDLEERCNKGLDDCNIYMRQNNEIQIHDDYDEIIGRAQSLINEGITQSRAQIHELSQIIANALLIIDSGGISTKLVYQEDAPRDLTDKATSDRPGANKAQKKLKALGYVSLRHYEVPNQNESPTIDAEERQVRPHYRRGHWRRKRFGAGLTETRRIRIPPVIVKKAEGNPVLRKGYKLEKDPTESGKR